MKLLYCHVAMLILFPFLASQGCYVFVNNSNLWIPGQKVSAKKLEDTNMDNRYRIDHGKLLNMLTRSRINLGAHLYGSRPPPNDSVWKAVREKNFEVEIFDRSESTGREKEPNSAMATQITMTVHTLDPKEKENVIIVIVTGDRNLKPPIEGALKAQIPVELWSWEDSMAREFKILANTYDHFTVKFLDEVIDTFSTINVMSSSSREINPARAIVYQDTPNTEEFFTYIIAHLHRLKRLFYVTLVDSQKEGKRTLVVEFPKTNLDVIFQRLQLLGNFPYQPCSYSQFRTKLNDAAQETGGVQQV